MKTFPVAEATWSGRVAARLRVVQTTCAEDDADLRLDLLKEEIQRALREVAPAQQAGCLEALSEAFPDFAASSAVPAPAPEAADAAIDFPTLPPEVLMADLIDAAPTLSPEERADYGRRLAAAGFALPAPASSGATAGFELPGEVRARFSLAAAQAVDPIRAMRLFGMLADLATTLDQLAWSVWKQLAPQSAIRREAGAAGDFRKLAALYLSGDPEVASPQLTQLLDRTRQLIASVLAGLGPAGGMFARDFIARFSPAAIEARAGGGFFTGGEQRNWRAYVEMFGQVTEQAIEHEVLADIVQYAESAILGSNRPPAAPAIPTFDAGGN